MIINFSTYSNIFTSKTYFSIRKNVSKFIVTLKRIHTPSTYSFDNTFKEKGKKEKNVQSSTRNKLLIKVKNLNHLIVFTRPINLKF